MRIRDFENVNIFMMKGIVMILFFGFFFLLSWICLVFVLVVGFFIVLVCLVDEYYGLVSLYRREIEEGKRKKKRKIFVFVK